MKRRSWKINLRQASIVVLEGQFTQARANLLKAEEHACEVRIRLGAVPSGLHAVERRIDELESETSRILKDRQYQAGLVRKLLTASPLSKEGRTRLQELRNESRELQERKRQLQHEQRELESAYEFVAKKREWVAKLERALGSKRRKKEKIEELKAAAASNTATHRMMAQSIKRQLTRDPFCPYCGDHLGDVPHADHIYPIAKGGRSVARNMVWVCSSCNGQKRDLTLAAFISKLSLNRDQIEERLRNLGKDF